jgi:hypothetical protein
MLAMPSLSRPVSFAERMATIHENTQVVVFKLICPGSGLSLFGVSHEKY